MKKIFSMILIISMFVAVSLSAKDKKEKGPDSKEGVIFTKTGTLPGGINVEFSVVTLSEYKKDVEQVFDYTFSETKRIAELFNAENSNSDLAQIAAEAGKSPAKVSKETLVLATHAKEIAEWTRGAFEPVKGAGNFKNLKIDKGVSTVYLTKADAHLELHGILEGFMADLFIRAAYHANIEDAFVRVNGVCRSMGQASYGPWRITLEGNGDKMAKHGMSIAISNYSSATVGGGHPAPKVDPRTGKEIKSPFYSVTVLTKQAATAEGVASSIFVMKPEEGENLVTDLGIRAIYGYRDGTFKKIGKW